jgi:hypothetical protein
VEHYKEEIAMATYEVKAPDGSTWEVNAPDDASQEKVLEYAKSQWSQQQRSVGQDLGRQVGLTARAGIKGILGLPTMVGDALFGVAGQPGRTSQALDRLLNRVLPEPENATERVAGDVAGALSGVGGIARLAQATSPASTLGQNVAKSLYANIPMQAASAVTGSGAAGVTREAGGGPLAQLAAGLVGGVAVPMGMQLAANAGSSGTLARSLEKSAQKPFAQEGERLAAETGIELTPGARTGNRFMTAMENTARQYGPTSDRVQDIDLKIANQAINRVASIADKISKNTPDPESLGNQIQTTVQSAARQLDKMRSTVADRDYGLVRQIAGDGKVIRLQGFADELSSIIDDYSNVAGADAQKVVAQARAALNRITGVTQPGVPDRVIEAPKGNIKLYGVKEQTGTLDNSISEAMRTRSFYGKAARGSANVFEDIAPDLQRSLSSRLFRAINDDFDNAAQGANGPLKQALAQANNNYKKASQSLEFLEQSALGKLIGDDLVDAALSGAKVNTTAGEQITQRIAGMHPSVRKNSIEMLNRWNPQLATDIRAQFLRDALDRGMAMPPSTKGTSQVPISFNRFLTALGSEKVGFQKNLESYGFTAAEIKDIKDTAAAMLRQGDRTGYNFSGTEVMRQNTETAQALGDAAISAATGGVTGLIKNAAGKGLTLAGKRIGMNKIVDAMASAEGRKALQTLSKPTASPQAIAAAFATIDDNPSQ